MTLYVDAPNTYQEERQYILSVVLQDFLGLDFQLRYSDRRDLKILMPSANELIIADKLFQTPQDKWLTDCSLPQRPLQTWAIKEFHADLRLGASEVPVIYGKVLSNGEYWQIIDKNLHIGLDIFGSAFYMLTRYEEVVASDRDKYSRFPASASLSHQENFADRPIVNEYLEILWACLNRLCPRLRRRRHEYKLVLTHDVDHPLSVANKSWPAVLRNACGDVIRRKDIRLVSKRLYARSVSTRGNFEQDPCNTFDFIMNISEKYGLQGVFYFITDHSAGAIDGDYSIDMPWVRQLMQRIHSRGHEIGLHPSFETFRSRNQMRREFIKLLQVAEIEGITQTQWGSRQHYLRWDPSETWQICAEVGLDYDSTLGYAERQGFRCGVCYEFPTFSLIKRQQLKLRERPLIVMDTSILNEYYSSEAAQIAQKTIENLAYKCKLFNGKFVLLWHNSRLISRRQKQFYKNLVSTLP